MNEQPILSTQEVKARLGVMKRRDDFATCAPPLLAEELASIVPVNPGETMCEWRPRAEAEWSYLYADAMIAESNKFLHQSNDETEQRS